MPCIAVLHEFAESSSEQCEVWFDATKARYGEFHVATDGTALFVALAIRSARLYEEFVFICACRITPCSDCSKITLSELTGCAHSPLVGRKRSR
jgi:hypothetical protein